MGWKEWIERGASIEKSRAFCLVICVKTCSTPTPDYFCVYSQATLRYTIWKWSFLSVTKTAFTHGHLLYHHFWKRSSVTDSLYLIIGANFWESVQAEPCWPTVLKRLSHAAPTGEFKQIDSLQPSCKRMCGGQHNKQSVLWKLVFQMCRSSYQGWHRDESIQVFC